ncbi:MAG: 3-hydroxyacyl-CoA dehydrogenase NAD-binding domain-containing protein, partial [Pseudomonadota bacterium]
DSGTNTLSNAVLEELDQVLKDIEASGPKGLIIRSGKTSGFIAGADITEFTVFEDTAQIEKYVRQGREILDRLAAMPFPTVALIHGFCMGGGLELALACRYRIARSDSRLALPEILLGIHPGLGGTVRMTRLLPAPAAMNLMLTGRGVDARTAKRMGMVHLVAEQRHLEKAARDAVIRGLKARQPWHVPLWNSGPVRALLAKVIRRKTEEKVRADHYPAPFALIDLWRRYGGDAKAMADAETVSIAKLMTGDTAQNLIRVFFLRERLKSLGKSQDIDIRHLHVVGAGIMGGDIAAWSALQGLKVTVQDQSPERLAPAIGRAAGLFKKRLKYEAKISAAMDRLIPDIRGYGVRQADIVIEAIIADRNAKQGLFREIEPRLKPHALLSSNTSSIPLEILAEALERPEQLVGIHFFNPVDRMPLVEVVHGAATSDKTKAIAQAFVCRIDRLPLPVKSSPGFLVNRVLMPYLLEAVSVLEEGTGPAVIDAAAESFGMPMGPIELADRVGLDICLNVAKELGGEIPTMLQGKVDQGRLGRKSGHGFYRYKAGKPEKPAVKATAADPDLQDRLILSLINACVACLREKVIEDGSLVDAGLIFGTGFAPFRGGPIHYAKKRGPKEIVKRLEQFEQQFGPRFRPDPGWRTEFTGEG